MKKICKRFFLPAVFSIVIFAACFAIAASFDPEKYKEVEWKQLKTAPEDYKNDKIFFVTVFFNFKTAFPAYIEKSGFKPGKDVMLNVAPSSLPVMMEKNDELNKMLTELKKKTKIKIYGKIKKFKSTPKHKSFPRYYLEGEYIEVLKGKQDDSSDSEFDKEDPDENNSNFKRRWR